mmetsp:Transcript_9495/g.29280  ORF Transcript_9495/g.29280 Transcript_9495/m.29280 type:complete len:188 (-) Transcript_9495:46-609(-)
MTDVDASGRPASLEDAPAVFALVNRAYAVEKDGGSLSFKRGDRYDTCAQVEEDISRALDSPMSSAFWVWFCHDVHDSDSELSTVVGVARLRFSGSVCGFGPFAVDPCYQGRGIGSSIIHTIHRLAIEHACSKCAIEVVNHRTDLLPFYSRHGYREIGTAPCDRAHNCDETKLVRPSHFVLLEKDLLV